MRYPAKAGIQGIGSTHLRTYSSRYLRNNQNSKESRALIKMLVISGK